MAIIIPYKGETVVHENITEEQAKKLIEEYGTMKKGTIMREDGLFTHLYEGGCWK